MQERPDQAHPAVAEQTSQCAELTRHNPIQDVDYIKAAPILVRLFVDCTENRNKGGS
jgi:hypothetical protein